MKYGWFFYISSFVVSHVIITTVLGLGASFIAFLIWGDIQAVFHLQGYVFPFWKIFWGTGALFFFLIVMVNLKKPKKEIDEKS